MQGYGGGSPTATVRIERAFAEDACLILGRAAAAHPRFPPNPAANNLRVMTGASCGFDEDEVRCRSFAELVEHVSACLAAFEPGRTTRASARELEEVGERFLRPRQLSHTAHGRPPGGPGHSVAPETPLTWCRARRVTTGEELLAPALVSFLQWRPPEGEPLFARPDATGLAAHLASDEATRHALLEVVERDACALSWAVPGWPVWQLDEALLPLPLAETCAALGLRPAIYGTGLSDLPPTVIALLAKEGGESLTCGSACGEIDEMLVGRAVREALMLQWSMRRSSHPRRPPGNDGDTSLNRVFMNFRDGRAVLEWYGAQASRTVGALARPRGVPDAATALACAVEKALGGTVAVVDVTDRVAECSGWHVCRVLVPAAVPLSLEPGWALSDVPRVSEVARQFNKEHLPLQTAPCPFG